MPQAKKWHLSKLRVKVNFVSSIQHLDRKKKLNSIRKWLRNWNNISTTQRLWYCIWCAFASSFICETNLKWTLFVSIFWLDFLIKRFHMTSRRPSWCSKTLKWRPINQSINLFLSIRGMGLPRSSELDAHEWNVDVWR